MQQIGPGTAHAVPPALVLQGAAAFTPDAMAQYLRRTNGDAALCFAQAMHDGSAWANDAWGAYWADVVRLV